MASCRASSTAFFPGSCSFLSCFLTELRASNSFCNTDPDVARDFARATFFSDNRADLSAVPVPTLMGPAFASMAELLDLQSAATCDAYDVKALQRLLAAALASRDAARAPSAPLYRDLAAAMREVYLLQEAEVMARRSLSLAPTDKEGMRQLKAVLGENGKYEESGHVGETEARLAVSGPGLPGALFKSEIPGHVRVLLRDRKPDVVEVALR